MDHGDHHELQQEIHKTVVLGVVLILCVSVPVSLWISRHVTGPKKNDGVWGLQFDLGESVILIPSAAFGCVNRSTDPKLRFTSELIFEPNAVFAAAPFYDAVSKWAPEDSLQERMRVIGSFPFARMLYVIGSFLFLGLTLQLNIAQVSVLAWVLTVLCNFVFFLDRLASAVAGAP